MLSAAVPSIVPLIDEIGELTTAPTTDEWRAKMSAAQLRWEQSQRDHAEVAEARRLLDERISGGKPRDTQVPPKDSAEPAEVDFDSAFPDYDSEAI